MGVLKKFFDNIESYICQLLLATFVCLLFAQIVSRQLFGYSISWTEELSVYLFVWFVFFGASYAARLAAHNRVTFQYKIMPKALTVLLEILSDLIWVAFNIYFVYLSYSFIFETPIMKFWKSQTLGVPMKYIFLILPIAFSLLTIRILQVLYLKHIKGVDIKDPDSQELEELSSKDISVK